ncbi:CG32544 [Drosophila busckii]|uniref:CG32544 n=1 Tax=Drosophila busckii TaxID=30019 RepID=A0A0M5J3D6_DROBS|nr:uncharacterized protein LOC108606465 [Drosophila busckii]ALC49686.1 CG32544 [Drosophila busckii]
MDSYEQECQRAELLGLKAPDQAEFERQRSARLEQQQAELDAAEAAVLVEQEEQLQATGGKLDELNSILSSTQQKLNRFKQSACGSLTNIFQRAGSLSGAAAEVPSVSEQPVAAAAVATPMLPPTAEQVAAAKAAKQLKMDAQLDKLDTLINKADNAQLAMSEQTKQMRRIAK